MILKSSKTSKVVDRFFDDVDERVKVLNNSDQIIPKKTKHLRIRENCDTFEKYIVAWAKYMLFLPEDLRGKTAQLERYPLLTTTVDVLSKMAQVIGNVINEWNRLHWMD